MVHTVLGDIRADELGLTLMHEHIIWDWRGADCERTYDTEEAVRAVLPQLLELKGFGCRTLVEATPRGAGRDMEIFRECSKRSGINIVTCTGAWDGGDAAGKFVPAAVREGSADDIASAWTSEYQEGIDGTGVRPGFIKLALGDKGVVTALQEKLLRAAARTGKETGLPVQCHTFVPASVLRAVEIIEEEGLPLDRFIWVHADGARDFQTAKTLAQKGIWLEYDCLARIPDYSKYVNLIKATLDSGIERLLLSQDAGSYNYGTDDAEFYPYTRLFTEFMPACLNIGIPKEKLYELMTENPGKVLDT